MSVVVEMIKLAEEESVNEQGIGIMDRILGGNKLKKKTNKIGVAGKMMESSNLEKEGDWTQPKSKSDRYRSNMSRSPRLGRSVKGGVKRRVGK